MEISGQIVLITGASRGIGGACAAAFRERGAKLCLTARDGTPLERQSSAEDVVMPGNITNATFRSHLVDTALARFGRIDILINNAGAGLYWPPSTAPLDDVRYLFELNFFAPLALSQLVLPHMRSLNYGPRSGWLIIAAQRLFPKLVEARLTAFMKKIQTGTAA